MASKNKSTSSGTVTVYCNLPSGISFRLPNGRKLTFAGYPASRLVSGDGTVLPAGQYGKTRNVPLADWEYIQKTYGKAAYFNRDNPLLFAAASAAEGDAQAADQSSTRHGMEQIDATDAQQTRTESENKKDGE